MKKSSNHREENVTEIKVCDVKNRDNEKSKKLDYTDIHDKFK